MKLSPQFISKLKMSVIPAYKLALEAGLNPNILSKYVIGYHEPKPFDKRLIYIGELLGMEPDEVFVCEETEE